MQTLGLYIHIPFCIKKCLYCDFYSIPNQNDEFREQYVNALINHIAEYKKQAGKYVVASVYIGGGTPSILTPLQLKRIMKEVKSDYNLAKNCEISMEVNPGTVDLKKLSEFRKSGINRLSIGMQSFVKEELTILGRIHTPNDSIAAFKAAKEAGFDNINIDLMFGLPNQDATSAIESYSKAMTLKPEHISYYCLKVEENTPFFEMRDHLNLPSEDTESEIYLTLCALLSKSGYEHYEISNFARKGKACSHNLRYWNCDEYLGFGPAAHSYFCGKRFSYLKDIAAYCESFGNNNPDVNVIDEFIDIPKHTQIAEYVMLRFRLREGINTDNFYNKFKIKFEDLYLDKMMPFLNSGHIIKTKKGYALPEGAMYVSNYILARIIDFDMKINI